MAFSGPLRIALVSEHASPLATLGGVDAGGQNVYVDQVARALARLGHRVDVLTRRDDPALPRVVELEPGARVVHVDAGPASFVPKERMLGCMDAFASEATRIVTFGEHDVVHANFFMSGLVGLAVKAALGVPLVVTFHALGLVRRAHQGEADGFPDARIDIERRIVHGADRLIAECPEDEDDLGRHYAAPRERIDTIPCGVDLDAFAPRDRAAARDALGLAHDGFHVLQLGRMVPRKGVDDVIRAVARLAPRDGVRLLVVGGDGSGRATPELDRLRSIAGELGVADRVTFAGHRVRSELPMWYAACDAFVTTPWYEPFGITPLEAMACSRPVVASAVGGLKHTVLDRETGFLVPPRDPVALAERLSRLQAEPRLAEALGRAGARRAKSEFTWERVAGDLERVYRAVAMSRRRRLPARVDAGVWGRRAAANAPWPAGAVARAAR